jgi:hypothetical protein
VLKLTPVIERENKYASNRIYVHQQVENNFRQTLLMRASPEQTVEHTNRYIRVIKICSRRDRFNICKKIKLDSINKLNKMNREVY